MARRDTVLVDVIFPLSAFASSCELIEPVCFDRAPATVNTSLKRTGRKYHDVRQDEAILPDEEQSALDQTFRTGASLIKRGSTTF